MKKLLLTAAIGLALTSLANAQSSVTIYGTVDLAVAKSNGGTAANAAQGGYTSTSNSYQLIQGHANRLGFRGNEDLGSGLSAQFQIEHRFSADTGANSNATAFWQGLSYVQLTSTQLGKVYLGRNYTPAFLLTVRIDPFGLDGIGEGGWQEYGYYHTPDPAVTVGANGVFVNGGSVRESNAIGYVSPSFNGFFAHLATSLSEATQNGRVNSVNLNYDSGPLYVGLNAEKVKGGLFRDQGLYQLGASYDLGFTKLMGYAAKSMFATNYGYTSPTTPVTSAHIYQVGAITPVGGGAIKATYLWVDAKRANQDQRKLGLGYDYFLSKRTKLYADGSYTKQDLKTNNKTVALGIRHDF
jgi:predicted porin